MRPTAAVVTPTRWLTAIVLLGAGLRLFPIWFGLPYLQARPDEDTAILHAAAVLNGDLNPHFFHWPSFTFYAFAAVLAAASRIRSALFLHAPLTAAEQIIIARAFVALAGTMTIVVLFQLARRMADHTTGLLAAFFMAVTILHVRDSHFAMTDVLMTLLVTASLAFLVRAADDAGATPPHGADTARWFAAAGLAGGLAASTKYSAAAIIAGMAAAQVLSLRHSAKGLQAWKPSLVFLAAFGCGFLLGTPYALLDFKAFAADLGFDFTHLSGGHTVSLGRGWSYHLTRSLPYGVGAPICAAAIAGIVPMVKDYARQAFVIGAFSLAFYASIGSGYTVFFRYILPLVPIVCVAAAIGVRHVGPWFASRTGLSIGAAVALLAALVGGPALVNSVWFDVLLAKTDTRVLAGRWLIPRLTAEETLHEAGGLFSALDLSAARFHRWSFDPVANTFGDPDGHTPDWLVFEESPLWTYATVAPQLRQLAQDKYVLVQVVRATKGPGAAGPINTEVYDLQDAFFMPMSGFSTIERPGPTVLIYWRGNQPRVAEDGGRSTLGR